MMANESHIPEMAVDDLSLKLENELQISNAIKISRQFMILLEDYRYLMSCYQETCGCHVNFDHQIFFHKLEEKYNMLADIATSNSFLTNALDDNCDYETLSHLWSEMKTHSPLKSDNRKLFIERIKLCDKPVPTNVNITTRIEHVAPNNEESDQEMTETIEQNIDLKSEKLAFRCTHVKCDFLTFNQDDIMKHFNNHGGLETTKRFEKNDVLYVCDQCGKEFSGQKWLENHIENVHAYVKIFSCDFPSCQYKTKFRCVMDDHRKRHGANKEFKCTWSNCESEFVTKRDMLAHINFYHKGIKNYTCSWQNCAASFKDSNRLRHHLFTHTGERPYSCDYPGCHASFKQMPHLHKHRKTHNTENQRGSNKRQSVITCTCPVKDCGASFHNEDELNKHISLEHEDVHQLFKCETQECNRYFVVKEECQLHMKEDHDITVEEEITDD